MKELETIVKEWETYTPEQKRAVQKEEAILRLKMMDYYGPSIKLFEKEDKVMNNMPPVGAHFFIEDSAPEIKKQMDELTEQFGWLFYAVTECYANFGHLYNCLFVGTYPEEWSWEREDINEGLVYAYVINESIPEFSEPGSIAFKKTIAGGIARTA